MNSSEMENDRKRLLRNWKEEEANRKMLAKAISRYLKATGLPTEDWTEEMHDLGKAAMKASGLFFPH